jgi:hypothetical protein
MSAIVSLDDDENDPARGARAAGSIDGVGWRFQAFKINDLEMVARTTPVGTKLHVWLRQLAALRLVA